MTGVVGASARAAAMTLARLGEPCWAVDLFNDRDLKRIAPCARCPIEQFPRAIPELAKQFPPGPVLLAGGMENHPDAIAELARTREVLGPSAEAVKRVRNPFQLENRPTTLSAGSVVPEPDAQARDWLLKSLRSSGGLGVRWGKPGEVVPVGHVAQQFIDGTTMSAVYRDDVLLGVTEQLVGIPWLHAKPFHYAGTLCRGAASDGSQGWSEALRAEPLETTFSSPFHSSRGAATDEPPSIVGRRSAAQDRAEMFGLSRGSASLHPWLPSDAAPRLKAMMQGCASGFHGIDFILNDNTPYVLEINPRYPASVEAIEFANHLGCTVGKAIWFAPHAFRFPDAGPWDDDLAGPFDPWRLPRFADIPEPGEPFEPGNPVITFFATGRTSGECRERLQSQSAELDRLFAGTTS